MKKITSIFAATVLVALVVSGTAQAQTQSITGAATGLFPSGVSLYGVSLNGLKLGNGLTIASDGTAAGQFEATLNGQIVVLGIATARTITVEGEVSSGSIDANGNPTFNGFCEVDLGDGTPPLLNIPFVVTLLHFGDDTWTVALTVAQTALQAASITEGSLTVQPNE